MKIVTIAMLLLTATAASAQQWEFGADGGAGLMNTVNITGAPTSGTAGFQPGFVAGAFLGQNMKSHLAGEIRYEFMQSDLRLDASGQKATFAGQAHAVHYDFVYRSNRGEASTNFFVSGGAGVKAYFANGVESATQPLSQYGYFTKGHSMMALATASVGVNFKVSQHVSLRIEARDFITKFPTAVITPPPGVKYGTMLNELTPMVSVVYSK